jgi:hypothetical protein
VDRIAAAVLMGFIIMALTLAWLGRYETTAQRGGVYVTDRWAGTVSYCLGYGANAECLPVFPPANPPP